MALVKPTSEVTIRAVTMDDAELVFELITLAQLESNGKSSLRLDELIRDWEEPGFDLAESTRIVLDNSGQALAYGEMWAGRAVPVRPHVWLYVHPEHRKRGIGTQLFQWAEKQAHTVFDKVPADARVVLETNVRSTHTHTRQFLERMGMTYADRSWWHMVIQMDEAPPRPVWPEGITVTTVAAHGDLKEAYKASKAAFQDHRGYVEEPFEIAFARWQHHLEDPNVDLNLFFLAMDGDKIAGVSFCYNNGWQDPDEAYIGTLGVVREYRRRGIASALLHHSFGFFWDRDRRKVGLHVDGSSLTGATVLYEKAGMYIDTANDAYEKELRPGRELSRQ